jgi:sulfate permease, SulP family
MPPHSSSALSLLNTFINVPMPRSDMFLRDLWHVLMQLPLAHWPTIAFGIGTLAVMSLLKRWIPKLPGVLAVVVLGTIVSAAVGFVKTDGGRPEQIVDAEARAAFEKYAQLETALASNKQAQGELRGKIATLAKTDVHDYTLESEELRLSWVRNRA